MIALSCFLPCRNHFYASPVPGYEEGGRRNWVLEQLAVPPNPTSQDKNRTQASFNFAHFGDSVSFEESALLNLTYVELGAKFSQRLYPQLTGESRALKVSSLEERNTATIELARNFIAATNHYGRLGVEYVHFFPRETRYLHVGINMGMLESPENPYSFRITVSHFKKLAYQEYNVVSEHEEGSPWVLASEIGYAYTNELERKWRMGGFLKWCYRQRSSNFEKMPNLFKVYEHMLFTFGPFSEWHFGNSNLRLAANFRMLIDKSVELEQTTVIEESFPRAGYPISFRLPDISFQYTYIF